MDGVSPVVQKKRFVFVLANELGGFLRHTVFDMLARFSNDRRVCDEFPRGEVARPRPGCSGRVWKVHVEPLIFWLVAIIGCEVVSKVPLAKMRRGIACFMQRLGECEVFGFQA